MRMAHLIQDLSCRPGNNDTSLVCFIQDPYKPVIQSSVTFRL